jgi:hypothetical protein
MFEASCRAQALVEKLKLNPRVLLSARCCSKGWIRDPSLYYVCDRLGFTREHWRKYSKKALK